MYLDANVSTPLLAMFSDSSNCPLAAALSASLKSARAFSALMSALSHFSVDTRFCTCDRSSDCWKNARMPLIYAITNQSNRYSVTKKLFVSLIKILDLEGLLHLSWRKEANRAGCLVVLIQFQLSNQRNRQLYRQSRTRRIRSCYRHKEWPVLVPSNPFLSWRNHTLQVCK